MIRVELGPQTMIPLDPGIHAGLGSLVTAALFNISRFDGAAHSVWLNQQTERVQKVARTRPPDRLYRVISDNEREGAETPLLLGVILGYASGLCGVHILGVRAGPGSAEDPILVPADALENVTEKARAGKLPTLGRR